MLLGSTCDYACACKGNLCHYVPCHLQTRAVMVILIWAGFLSGHFLYYWCNYHFIVWCNLYYFSSWLYIAYIIFFLSCLEIFFERQQEGEYRKCCEYFTWPGDHSTPQSKSTLQWKSNKTFPSSANFLGLYTVQQPWSLGEDSSLCSSTFKEPHHFHEVTYGLLLFAVTPPSILLQQRSGFQPHRR